MSKINIYDDLQNQKNDKIEAIKKILPDCFDKDGNLIGEKLQEIFSGSFAVPDTERFTFNWAGKQKAREIASKTYTEGTLAFDKARSKNFDETKNLIIEGDNLQVLKLLKNSYKGKVKCIYIDPPYNTGNDFVYNDKFELDIQKYLIETGEIDEETGEQLTDYIQKDDGKKHSKWLSFMYPRLMAAREMLREDGVIFISIDDNEVHHLRLLMNEVFGEGEFVGCFVWHKKTQPSFLSKEISIVTEYILSYRKNESLILNGGETDPDKLIELLNISNVRSQRILSKNNVIIQNGNFNGRIEAGKYGNGELEVEIVNSFNVVSGIPDDDIVINGRIKWTQEKIQEEVNQKAIIHIKSIKSFRPTIERIEKQINIKPPISLLSKYINDIPTNTDANNEIKSFFEMPIFDYSKPTGLIKYLIKASTQPNDLILDFFAGSGTTGQAVMELNQEEVDKNLTQPPLKGEEARQSQEGLFDKNRNNTHHQASSAGGEEKAFGGRKFILVQLPEKIDEKKEAFKTGYKKISDITIERVRRAGEKYKSVDNGFKVLTLADNPDRENLWNLGNLNDNEFILTHLALFYGYGLNYKAEKIAEKEIYIMKSEIEKTKDAIVIMEQKPLTMEDIMYLIENYGKGRYKFFSRDCALNIELTYNLLQHFKEDNVIVF